MKTSIQSLSKKDIQSALSLLAASPYQPYRFLGRDLGEGLIDYWQRTLEDHFLSASTRGFLARQDDKVSGLLVISENPWETSLLGRKAAIINCLLTVDSQAGGENTAGLLLDPALEDCARQKVGFVLCKTYTDNLTSIHALESRGFLLMDTLVDCAFDYRAGAFMKLSAPVPKPGISIRPAEQSDRQELVQVASLAFRSHFGRYHADERIGQALATRVYEEWMRSCLDGYADTILLAILDDRIVGFSIWKLPSAREIELKVRVGHYSIAGIHPNFAGKGLFTLLTHAGMQYLDGRVDIIEGPTHINNYGVQVGYSKLGWRVCVDARHSFHKWLD
jgi:GNAT superfamily N-acetyltransferase